MVIAEALNQRKTLYTKAKALADQIGVDAIVEKKNPDGTAVQVADLLDEMQDALHAAETLTIRINLANNRESIEWGGNRLSIMEAIARRDQMTLEHQLRTQIQSAIDEALGKRRSRMYGYGRKTKDDVKEVSLIDRDEFRKTTDALAEQRRGLDIAIQKANWSVDL